MGKIFLFLASLLWVALGAEPEARLEWKTRYEEGLEEAKKKSRPLILFFTGSDWCGWCHKLEKEVLNTPEFAALAGKEFVFVTIDFPLHKPTDPKVAEQNKQLQKRFNVKGFPTLVILDSDEQKIGVTGYLPGGAKSYAEHLLKLVKDYSQYNQKMGALDSTDYSANELKELYSQAKNLGRADDAASLVSYGLKSDDKIFFLMERFRQHAADGRIHTPSAQAIKQEILSLDPQNQSHTQYDLALIEFEANSLEVDHQEGSPELAIEPLMDYIKKFGQGDKENTWKLQMIISQVYLDNNRFQEALDFARASYETAPDPVKSEIATAVKNLQIAIKK